MNAISEPNRGNIEYFAKFYFQWNQGGLNKKEIQLNLKNEFSILIFNELLFA